MGQSASENKKPVVDKEKCTGCGTCTTICPDVFELKDGKSNVKKPQGCSNCNCAQAVESCPVGAITLE
jgi:ferredoxin